MKNKNKGELMYKLIAIDLDGTLLNEYSMIPESTIEVLRQAKARGVEIVLASGRPANSIINFAKTIGIDNYLIAGNGSLLYDIQKEENIFDAFFDRNQALQIADICEENSVYYNAYTEREIIADSLKYNVLVYEKENLSKPEGQRTHINIVPNIKKYISDSHCNEYLKMTICDESGIVFENILRKLETVDNIEILKPEWMSKKYFKHGTSEFSLQYYFSEITKKDIKWVALEALAKKLDIKQEEIIAIGDNVNDEIMIKNAGLGIAMENAAEDVKNVADYITDSYTNEGVRKAIEKFILNEN